MMPNLIHQYDHEHDYEREQVQQEQQQPRLSGVPLLMDLLDLRYVLKVSNIRLVQDNARKLPPPLSKTWRRNHNLPDISGHTVGSTSSNNKSRWSANSTLLVQPESKLCQSRLSSSSTTSREDLVGRRDDEEDDILNVRVAPPSCPQRRSSTDMEQLCRSNSHNGNQRNIPIHLLKAKPATKSLLDDDDDDEEEEEGGEFPPLSQLRLPSRPPPPPPPKKFSPSRGDHKQPPLVPPRQNSGTKMVYFPPLPLEQLQEDAAFYRSQSQTKQPSSRQPLSMVALPRMPQRQVSNSSAEPSFASSSYSGSYQASKPLTMPQRQPSIGSMSSHGSSRNSTIGSSRRSGSGRFLSPQQESVNTIEGTTAVPMANESNDHNNRPTCFSAANNRGAMIYPVSITTILEQAEQPEQEPSSQKPQQQHQQGAGESSREIHVKPEDFTKAWNSNSTDRRTQWQHQVVLPTTSYSSSLSSSFSSSISAQ